MGNESISLRLNKKFNLSNMSFIRWHVWFHEKYLKHITNSFWSQNFVETKASRSWRVLSLILQFWTNRYISMLLGITMMHYNAIYIEHLLPIFWLTVYITQLIILNYTVADNIFRIVLFFRP